MAFAKRRWPIVSLAATVLIIAVLALTRRRGAASTGEESGSKAVAGAEAGERLDTVVTLDSTSLSLTDLELAAVGTARGGALIANGTITYDANRVSVVAPRAEGRVVAVRADLGASVTVGSVLAVAESREVGQTRGEMERARANLEVAQNSFEREKRLYEQSISSQKEMLEAQAAYRAALADYNSAVAQISGLGAGAGQGGVYELTSPLAGNVVERSAMPGQIVGPSTNLFTIADLRRVWIVVDVYETDVGRVRRGAPAAIIPRGYPGEQFHGEVTYAGGVVDTSSRTFKVRVEVDNRGLRLRPGMFAQVEIATAPGTSVVAGGPLVVPEMSVQDLNDKTVVFVRGETPGRFYVRNVVVGSRARGGYSTIAEGLRLGETIVTKGAFQLRAQLLKGTFGDDEKKGR